MSKIKGVVKDNALGNLFWEVHQERAKEDYESGLQRALETSSWETMQVNSVGKDLHQSLFLNKPSVKDDVPEWQHGQKQVFDTLMDNQSMQNIRKKTVKNEASTQIFWNQMFPDLMTEIEEIVKKDKEREEEEEEEEGNDEGEEEGGNGGGGSNGEEGEVEDGEEGEVPAGFPELSQDAIDEIMDAFEDAAEEAEAELGDDHSWGLGAAEWQNLPLEDRIDLGERLSRNPQLLELIKLAGAMKMTAYARKRGKMTDAPEYFVDIELGRNLSKLTTVEKMRATKIGSPKSNPSDYMVGLDFLSRYQKGKLFNQKKAGTEVLSDGAIVVAVDCSGSMSGDEEKNAKALTLAISMEAAKTNRPVRVVLFSGNALHKDSPKAHTKEWFEWIEWVATTFQGGGTNFDVALTSSIEAFETEKEYNRADLVFITDGEAYVSSNVMNQVNESKKNYGWKMYSIYIGGKSNTLDGVSDKDVVVDRIDYDAGVDCLEWLISD